MTRSTSDSEHIATLQRNNAQGQNRTYWRTSNRGARLPMSLSGRESDVSPHFGLIPAALIIGHHFRISASVVCPAPAAFAALAPE
jgi:hypothetical protein